MPRSWPYCHVCPSSSAVHNDAIRPAAPRRLRRAPGWPAFSDPWITIHHGMTMLQQLIALQHAVTVSIQSAHRSCSMAHTQPQAQSSALTSSHMWCCTARLLMLPHYCQLHAAYASPATRLKNMSPSCHCTSCCSTRSELPAGAAPHQSSSSAVEKASCCCRALQAAAAAAAESASRGWSASALLNHTSNLM
jgi:hypothetical protein